MASTYTTNLGIEKIGTGEQSGTWGGTTNTNWDLTDEAINGIISVTLSSAGSSGSPTALPITDGASSNGRNKFIEFADGGDLGGTAYVQLTPNDAEKIVFFRNSLTSSRSVIVFQGNYSASNDFEIPNGKDIALKFNGAGTGATVTQLFVDLTVDGMTVGTGVAADTKIVYDGNAKDFYVGLDDSADKLVIGEGSTVGTNSILTLDDDSVTVGDGAAVDTKVVFDGNAQDYYIGLDDSADDLVIGLGSTVGTTPAIEIDENQDIKFAQSIGVGQAASSTTGDIVAQTMALKGTTPTLTIGDAGAEDTKIVFDGNAKDFYVGLDDSADKLVIGEGSTVGTNSILTLDDDSVTVGDGAAVDTKVVFDGNAQDYYIGLDDSADDLVIGLGSTVGTTPAIEIDENQDIKFAQSIGVGQAASSTTGDIVAQTMALKGTTPTLTIGDAGAEDTKIVFDGNAKDFYIGLDDSADKLVIGEGSTVGTNSILTITDDSVTIGDAAAVDSKLVFDGNAQDFYVALDDSADDLLIGVGSTVGTTPAIHIDENQVVKFDAGIQEESTAVSSSSNAATINLNLGTVFTHTLSENVTYTFSNPAASGYASTFILKVTQDSSARTITWPGSVDWAGGTAPTISTGSGDVDVFVFHTVDGGTIYYGFTAGQDLT